jgi:uncharacterized protein (TIRG00374 family)
VTQPAWPGARSRALGRALRLSVALGLTVWLIAEASPGEVLASLKPARPLWVAAAVALVILDRGLMAYRWLLLLRAIEPGRDLPFGAMMRVFFVSTFVGSFLPAGVGGAAARTVALARHKVPAADALASVVVDGLLGGVSVLIAAAGGLFLVRQALEGWPLVVAGAVSVAIVGSTLLLLFDSRILTGLVRWLTARHLPRIQRMAEKALAAIRQYGHHRDRLAIVLVASVAVQVLRVLQAWCLAMALGLSVGIAWYFAFVPVIVFVMIMPISVAGIGTSQAAFVFFFGRVGMAVPDALALSFLFLALAVVGNLPGGLLVGFSRRSLSAPAASSSAPD